MRLPSGLTSRPLAANDAGAVAAVLIAQEIHDVGEAGIDESDVVADWSRPSFDVADSTVGVFDGDLLVAYAEVTTPERGNAAVHPSYRGRGLGTALALWMQAKSRSRGMTVVQMQVPSGSPGDQLLESLGYDVPWTAWDLALPSAEMLASVPPPPGYVARPASPGDHRACWQVLDDSFLEWATRARVSFDDWCAGLLHRPGFEPWHLRVAIDERDSVAGVCVVVPFGDAGYIERLAVHSGHRRRGLALALIGDSFALAAAHGATVLKVSTDSRTGALGLYERVGMQVTSTWNNRAKRLD